MQKNISIVGAGAWGSALAIALADNFDIVYLHVYNESELQLLKNKHPTLSVDYPENVKLVIDLSLIEQSYSVLIAVPSYGFSQTLQNIRPYLTKEHQICWVTKGFDVEEQCFLHVSFERYLNEHSSCVVSGPSFAFEVAMKKPTAIVAASKNKNTRDYWAQILATDYLRIYTNDDIIGVETGAAVKNILAIAAGVAHGLGFGANTQAAIITRGLAEMKKFGISAGGSEATFNGLSGIGDLILTCTDDLSRNRRFGKELVNNTAKQALKNIGSTVEGLNALDFVLAHANKNNIQMPICESVKKIIAGQITPITAVNLLMSREQIKE